MSNADSDKDNKPKSLKLGDYTYVFKDQLKNYNFTFRCKHRTICKVVIKIDKSNLIKYNKNLLDDITYSITSTEKNHTCKKAKEEKVININSDLIKNKPNI